MVRTQISLTEEQYRFLRDFAKQSGVSLSALLRRAVDALRHQEATPSERALQLLGAFEADRDDVSVRHDDYFAGSEGSQP